MENKKTEIKTLLGDLETQIVRLDSATNHIKTALFGAEKAEVCCGREPEPNPDGLISYIERLTQYITYVSNRTAEIADLF